MAAKSNKQKPKGKQRGAITPSKDSPFKEIQHPKKRAFLTAYSKTANIIRSCEFAKIDRSTQWHWMRDPDFAKAFETAKAMGCESLEAEAIRRATEGVQRLKFYEGEPIMVPALDKSGRPITKNGQQVLVPYVEHEFSDTLLIFLLKGANPSKYREKSDVNVGVNVGVQVVETDDWYGTKAAVGHAPAGDGASTLDPALAGEVQGRHLRASVGKNGHRSNGHSEGTRAIPGPEEGGDRRGEDLVDRTDIQGGIEDLAGPEESDEGGVGREE